jgi:chemotaxis protein MotB
MWILGATNESQRKSIAEYFKPTSIVTKADKSGGADGFFGGMSIIDPKALPSQASQTGLVQLSAPGREEFESTHEDQAMPEGLNEQERQKIAAEQDNKNFEELQKKLKAKLASDEKTADLLSVVKFVKEKEGLRIEILDTAGFSMFTSGTNSIEPAARELISKVGESLKGVANEIAIRGHTDGYQFKNGSNNNWSLSANRADATRTLLTGMGVEGARFARIEGVADSQPVNTQNPLDPKNRRISITVLYRDANKGLKPPAEAAQ